MNKKYEVNGKFVNVNLVKLGKIVSGDNNNYALRIMKNKFSYSKLLCDCKCLSNDCTPDNIRSKVYARCALPSKECNVFKLALTRDICDELVNLGLHKDDISEVKRSLQISMLLRSKWIIGKTYDEVVKEKAKHIYENFYKEVTKIIITKNENGVNIINSKKVKIKSSDKIDVLYPTVRDRIFCPVHMDASMFDKFYNILFSYSIDDNDIISFIKENTLDIYAYAYAEILNHNKSIKGLIPSILMKERTHQVIIRFKKPENEVIEMVH